MKVTLTFIICHERDHVTIIFNICVVFITCIKKNRNQIGSECFKTKLSQVLQHPNKIHCYIWLKCLLYISLFFCNGIIMLVIQQV